VNASIFGGVIDEKEGGTDATRWDDLASIEDRGGA